MQCVYQADVLLDARIVADQLARQGIHAEIFGGDLPGAAGELPAGGQVRVMVADEDVAEALRVVADWESTTARQAREHYRAVDRSRALAAFALGLITGIAGVVIFISLPDAPDQTRYFDHNGDQQPDAWHHFQQGRLHRIRKDRNFDGQADAAWTFTPDGRRDSAELDQDFDGRRETRVAFDNDLVSERRVDLDGDGRTDLSELYRHGVLRLRRYHHPDTGEVVKRTRYRAGILPRAAEIDTTGDGIAETRIRYDRYARPRRER